MHRFLCHKWSFEWMSICMLCLKYRVYIQVYRGCHCWHHVSAVNCPYIKPYIQYVLLAPFTVVLCLLQTLVHFSSFGLLTYILFRIIILVFPGFVDLVQIVACCYDMILYDMMWYDMSLFVCSHILFKSVSVCLSLSPYISEVTESHSCALAGLHYVTVCSGWASCSRILLKGQSLLR